jgi:thioredoxin 1
MPITATYASKEPTREEVDALSGPTIVEFGAPWCGHCQAAQPLRERALADHAGVRHLKIEDASGRRLGRSYRVKLWPTIVFLRDGQEVARLVRPRDPDALRQALVQIDPPLSP